MTDFNDVTHTFVDSLNQIVQYITPDPGLVKTFQNANTTFRAHKDKLTNVDGSKISFGGRGAKAFEDCVDHNIARAKPFEDHWNTLAENTTNLLAWFTFCNDEANLSLVAASPPGSLQNLEDWAAALLQYKDPNGNPYNFITVRSELQEAALKGTDMNTVMDKGKVQFLRNLDGGRDQILANLNTQHNSLAFQQNAQGNKLDETTTYTQAQQAVNGIHDEMGSIITNWFNQMTPVLADYEKGIQNNTLTVSISPGQYTSQTKTYHKLGITDQHTSSSGWTGWNPTTGGKYVIAGKQDVFGDKNRGFVFGTELDGPSASPQGSASLVSVTVNIGVDIAGQYYGTNDTLQLGGGLSVSQGKGIQVNFPFYKGGFTFGGAAK